MTPVVLDTTIGLEDVQRAAFYTIFTQFNDALDAVADKWASSDAELADMIGVLYEPTELEPIVSTHFHEGHKPSLLNAPVTNYPNVAVMCFRGAPSPQSDRLDHQDQYSNTLLIDVMVKSITDEGEVNRRVHRTAEAVNLCLQSDPTLSGAVSELSAAPSLDIANVQIRKDKEKGHYGNQWFWQGARLTYAVSKTANRPAQGGFNLQAAHMPTNIDQS